MLRAGGRRDRGGDHPVHGGPAGGALPASRFGVYWAVWPAAAVDRLPESVLRGGQVRSGCSSHHRWTVRPHKDQAVISARPGAGDRVVPAEVGHQRDCEHAADPGQAARARPFKLDQQLTAVIRTMTAGLEVSVVRSADWERAIFTGFDAWRRLTAAGGGIVELDADARALRILPTT